jgi:hypothetical protein
MATSRRKGAAGTKRDEPLAAAFVGAKRVGSKVIVFQEVLERKGKKTTSRITQRTFPAPKGKQKGLDEEALVRTLLPAFRKAAKEAAKAGPKGRR